MLADRPNLRDEIGLRRFANGHPIGESESASNLLGDQIPQQQLPLGPSHGG